MQQCKEWNGPPTSVEELRSILNSYPDQRYKIVRTDLSFYRDTHKADVNQQPDLFKIYNISHDEQLLNLCALLAEIYPSYDLISLTSKMMQQQYFPQTPSIQHQQILKTQLNWGIIM